MNLALWLTEGAFVFAATLIAASIMNQRPLRDENTSFAGFAIEHIYKTCMRGMLATKVPAPRMNAAPTLMDAKLYALLRKGFADELVIPRPAGCITIPSDSLLAD